MELVDDEDMETMIALYCENGSDKNAPIHLFAELASMEQNDDLNAYDEEHGAQEPCMVAPISYVDSESTIRGIDNDLNVTLDIDVVGDDGYDSSDPCDQEVDSDTDPDVDDVPDDIDDEDVKDDGNINASSRYSMNISVDYKVAVSKPTLYIGECWKSAEGCNWQIWEIRKFVGPHTYTSTHMSEDHRKLDSKTICTCIMPMVKDMPTIKVLVLIAEMQARFQYRVSYRKAWIAKQMAIEQLYEDFDASYNELQGWIAAIREYVPGTVIELQTRPYYGPDDQLQSGKRIFHQMFWTFDRCVRISPLQAVRASGWDLAIWKIYTDLTSCGCSRQQQERALNSICHRR
ncbi:hypothetical protein GOBAR_AA17583 [Gossypium barbadense]|uniref:Transposase MuDR plant domain-containing protein n=1 Tax=Gossypium barbadense TaxID=3634 RepID=A0A2P5XIC0_GOSBA|nr:hypothetical protein GOBAR_AA17583 [Gossypium barbadense]